MRVRLIIIEKRTAALLSSLPRSALESQRRKRVDGTERKEGRTDDRGSMEGRRTLCSPTTTNESERAKKTKDDATDRRRSENVRAMRI
mmetsp:Transcript_27061/g.83082  ORF Transcript_27061/g.83082 Transcript_27061/m.83082 type:complete len:88 (+) Transcript_27061:117-380(+)